MNGSTTTATLDQTDEDILTYEVSDEALEAAADTERGGGYRGYGPPFGPPRTTFACD
jgi:hypothetical protein